MVQQQVIMSLCSVQICFIPNDKPVPASTNREEGTDLFFYLYKSKTTDGEDQISGKLNGVPDKSIPVKYL
ncbi:hypothetical protein ADIAL_2023 [Alkalibacterium sp. AK22]|nr:hypothetical protein ADIAL_2023 [Alkalibacterium sp. AK22]